MGTVSLIKNEQQQNHKCLVEELKLMRREYGTITPREELDEQVRTITKKVLENIVHQNEERKVKGSSFKAVTTSFRALPLPDGSTVSEAAWDIFMERKDKYMCMLRVVCKISELALANSIPFESTQDRPSYNDIIDAAFAYAEKEVAIRLK